MGSSLDYGYSHLPSGLTPQIIPHTSAKEILLKYRLTLPILLAGLRPFSGPYSTDTLPAPLEP